MQLYVCRRRATLGYIEFYQCRICRVVVVVDLLYRVADIIIRVTGRSVVVNDPPLDRTNCGKEHGLDGCRSDESNTGVSKTSDPSCAESFYCALRIGQFIGDVFYGCNAAIFRTNRADNHLRG